MNFKIIKPNLTSEEFLNLLIETFPEVKEEVLDEDYAGLIHLQVARFADYVNKCAKKKRFDELQRTLCFFEATVDKVDPKVENAMYVSFLEHLDFDGLSDKEIKKYLKADKFDAWKKLRE